MLWIWIIQTTELALAMLVIDELKRMSFFFFALWELFELFYLIEKGVF